MPGAEQKEWIAGRLEDSEATWNLMAHGVVLVPISEERVDMWDGYPSARRRPLEAMEGSANPVMLIGDIRKHVAAEIPSDPADPGSSSFDVELVCTSVVSDGDGARTDGNTGDWLQHDYVKLYDGRRGTLHVWLSAQEMVFSFWVVDWIEDYDSAPKQLTARFTKPAGGPRLIPA